MRRTRPEQTLNYLMRLRQTQRPTLKLKLLLSLRPTGPDRVLCLRLLVSFFRSGNGRGERSDKDEKGEKVEQKAESPAGLSPLGLAASAAQLAEQFEISATPLDGSGLSPAPQKVCVGCNCCITHSQKGKSKQQSKAKNKSAARGKGKGEVVCHVSL